MIFLFLTYLKIVNEFIYYKNSVVNFGFYVNSSNNIFLIPLQSEIYSETGETSLVFFRLVNLSNKDFGVITTYTVFPSISSLYLNKLQCFCFEMIYLHSLEQVDLPVLFFLSSSILDDFPFIKKIILYYDIHEYNV